MSARIESLVVTLQGCEYRALSAIKHLTQVYRQRDSHRNYR